MERTVPFFNGCISFVAFIAVFVLVVYMLVVFVAGMFDIGLNVMSTIFTDTAERQSIFIAVNSDMLYNFAVLIMLMKAYQVLVGFMKEKRANIENVVELSIAVSLLELIFNSSAYSDQMQRVLAIMAAVLFATYTFRYHVRAIIEKLAPAPAVVIEEDETKSEFVVPMPVRRVRRVVESKVPARRIAKVVKVAKVAKIERVSQKMKQVPSK